MDADWQFDHGLTRFADIFFDNIFTDWSVQNRIGQAQQDARLLENKLVFAIGKLKTEIEKTVIDNQDRATELRSFLEQA